MSVITYKCPNCGGELIFDPGSGQYKCEYCMSKFSEEEVRSANPEAEGEEQSADEDTKERESTAEKGNAEKTGAVIYTCPSCGAEIITDETTAATFCFYCHNPVILTGRLSGEYLPDRVIPFAIDRKQAVEKFLTYVKKKKFIPRDFFDKEQLKKMTGVYFPYWIYGGTFDASYRAKGRKIRIWRAGDMEYTETSVYDVRREGTVEVGGLSRNALKKADKDLMECVLPYKPDGIKEFSMGYLSGFQAEKRDIERKDVEEELRAERDTMVQNALKNEAEGYSSMEAEQTSVRTIVDRWQYVLCPVWTLTYPGKNGKIYYYAMNGQTGKINGDFPVDGKKAAITSVISGLLVMVLMMVGGYFL
ncbi:MAG: TFIIB-type zinc ribbon-containing protein [Fusicatenibacter sp.]|nr:TFIIB-type zinc ribbon-containing protein [Fusicatenibacter sp.]